MTKKTRIMLRAAVVTVMLFCMILLTACGAENNENDSVITDTDTEVNESASAETEAVANTNYRLPSVPEDMWEHVYLSGRDIGTCLKLNGRNAFLCVFVDCEDEKWTAEDMDAAKAEFEKAGDLISSEAARYGAEAEAVFTYVGGTVTDPDAYFWLDILLEDAGYKSESWAREKVARDALAANGAVVVCFNSKDRSHALVGSTESSTERVTLYEYDDHTIAHEILHLFGAEDFYYPDEVKETADRILGDSIMSGNTLVVDPLTAYLVGWTDLLSDNALEFLEETAHITYEEWLDANKTENYTGYVENKQYDGHVYTGELKNGVKYGKGRLTFDSGNVYEGDFVYGQPHGKGTLIWTNGDVYVGDFTDGAITGKGTISIASSGSVYTGDFKDGNLHGYGVFTSLSGTVYEGEFVDGKENGKGRLTFGYGDCYEGDFVDGNMHGYGVYRWVNGDVYEGYFENSKMYGSGTLTYSDGTSVSGTWSNGELIE
ncbi:MAG: hypothetical protein IKV40_01185 [Clostridia bacterium]|nr:hypothetical protein [Clostridia bacterium]